MAVYKRSYRGYQGVYTPEWSRFLIVTRYATRSLFRSRVLTWLYILCLVPFLILTTVLYVNHNAAALLSLLGPRGIGAPKELFAVTNKFFLGCLGGAFFLAFLMASFIGPSLISPDLANNGLQLYLSRPFSRSEYVLGKFTAIARLLSFITWIPVLGLFLIQSALAGRAWMWANLYVAGAIVVGSLILITVLSLISLALSAWVKWKPVAGALLLGVMFMSGGLGAAINAIMRTHSGDLISIGALITAVWSSLLPAFRTPAWRRRHPKPGWR